MDPTNCRRDWAPLPFYEFKARPILLLAFGPAESVLEFRTVALVLCEATAAGMLRVVFGASGSEFSSLVPLLLPLGTMIAVLLQCSRK